jgi:hypothetical protein
MPVRRRERELEDESIVAIRRALTTRIDVTPARRRREPSDPAEQRGPR